MKIMITDSKGDSISITISNNGMFSELNKQMEKRCETRISCEEVDQSKNREAAATSSENTVEKSVDEASDSNLEVLNEQVKACLNQMETESGTESSLAFKKNETIPEGYADIKLAILSENTQVPGLDQNSGLMNDMNLPSLCRLCASRGSDMVYMFDDDEPYKNIIEKIEDCLPIMVTKLDALPKEACRSCLDKLELFYKFHKTVAAAEKHFLILGGKISYESEKATKYCQTISKVSRTRSSSTGNESVVNFDEGSQSEIKVSASHSVPNSLTHVVHSLSEEETSLDQRTSDSNRISNNRRKKRTIDEKVIHCQICGEGFYNTKKCQIHSRIHVKENRYPCSLCDDVFTSEKYWIEHNTEHIDSRTQYVCKICGKKFISEPRLTFHMSYHDPNSKPCYCKVCDEVLESESFLYQHIKTVHEPCKKDFRCDICGKQFRAQASVNAHQRKHRYIRSFECSICNKRFYSKDTLQMHEETHYFRSKSNDKNFSCLYCGKTFTEKWPLTIHILSHTDAENQSCGSESIKKTQSVNKSERNDQRKHNTTVNRPFKCSICERTFDHSARLREHASVHTGKRPFNCSICNKSFKRANARKVHMVIHTGEKPYQCDMCGTNFRRAGDMRRHKKTQHGQNE